jgi:sortase (surface protein transpeptidase)
MLRRRILTIGASVLMLVAGIVIVVAALAGVGGSKKNYSLPPPKESFSEPRAVTPVPEATATPLPEPTPVPSDAPVARLSIPGIKIDAPIEVQTVNPNSAMPDPKGYFDVAWYDLSNVYGRSSKPGWGSNAVFAGHVDCANCAPGGGAGAAIFWNLRNITRDDKINVALADGVSYTYSITGIFVVTSREDGLYDTSDGKTVSINDLVGPTQGDSITIITCGGTFNPRTHEYDKRLIVKGERTGDGSAEAQN